MTKKEEHDHGASLGSDGHVPAVTEPHTTRKET